MTDRTKRPQQEPPAARVAKDAPQSKEDIAQLPLASFEGEIHVVDTPERLAEALPKIRACPVLGLDTESRPSFKKGQHFPVALVQLASPREAWLIRICKLGFGPELVSILEDEGIVKVGVSLKDDVHRLRRLHPFQARNMVEMQRIATECQLEEQSLRKLVARVLGLRVSKRAQLTNWQAEELTEAQRKYAAADAWLCIMLLYHSTFGDYRRQHLPDLPPLHTL